MVISIGIPWRDAASLHNALDRQYTIVSRYGRPTKNLQNCGRKLSTRKRKTSDATEKVPDAFREEFPHLKADVYCIFHLCMDS